MKVKLGKLVAMAGRGGKTPEGEEISQGSLARLATTKGLSARLGFKIAKIVKAVNAEVETFLEARNKLILEFGEKNPKTGQTEVAMPGAPRHDPEKWDKFTTQVDELAETEVELNVKPVEIPPEFDGLEPVVLADLDGFITVKE